MRAVTGVRQVGRVVHLYDVRGIAYYYYTRVESTRVWMSCGQNYVLLLLEQYQLILQLVVLLPPSSMHSTSAYAYAKYYAYYDSYSSSRTTSMHSMRSSTSSTHQFYSLQLYQAYQLVDVLRVVCILLANMHHLCTSMHTMHTTVSSYVRLARIEQYTSRINNIHNSESQLVCILYYYQKSSMHNK